MRWTTAFIASIFIASLTAVLTCFNLPYISIHNVDMASATLGNPILYMVTAVLGILMMLFVARLFVNTPKVAWWTFVGSNTLGIFLIHKPVVVWLCGLASKTGITAWPVAVVCSLVAMAICCPVLFFINRTIPQILGNKKKQK